MTGDRVISIDLADGGTMMLPTERAVVGRGVVAGATGSGVSATVSHLVAELLDAHEALLLVDAHGAYEDLHTSHELLHVGASEDCDVTVEPAHAEQLATLALEERLPVRVDLTGFDEREADALFEALCEHLSALAPDADRSLLLVLAPLERFAPTGRNGGIGDAIDSFATGTDRSIGLLGVTARPSAVDRSFVSRTDWGIWHRLRTRRDRLVARRRYDRELARAVADLPDGVGLLVADWLENSPLQIETAPATASASIEPSDDRGAGVDSATTDEGQPSGADERETSDVDGSNDVTETGDGDGNALLDLAGASILDDGPPSPTGSGDEEVSAINADEGSVRNADEGSVSTGRDGLLGDLTALLDEPSTNPTVIEELQTRLEGRTSRLDALETELAEATDLTEVAALVTDAMRADEALLTDLVEELEGCHGRIGDLEDEHTLLEERLTDLEHALLGRKSGDVVSDVAPTTDEGAETSPDDGSSTLRRSIDPETALSRSPVDALVADARRSSQCDEAASTATLDALVEAGPASARELADRVPASVVAIQSFLSELRLRSVLTRDDDGRYRFDVAAIGRLIDSAASDSATGPAT